MNISEVGKNLIKSFEGCMLTAYKPVQTEQYYTIGWGHYGPDVYAGMSITQSQADALFDKDIVKYVNAVNSASLGFTPNQNQFDALCSFCYNLGTGIMADFIGLSAAQVANEIPRYVYGGGVVLPGLVRRRNMEVELFNSTSAGGSVDSSTGGTSNNGGEIITNQYSESGIAYPNVTLNIRNKPCASTGSVLDKYNTGESVIYDTVVVTNKYVWISWLPSSGGYRVYMAVRDIITGERFAECKDIPENESNIGETIQSKYNEDGIAYPKFTLNVRNKPCATTGTALAQYDNGENVIYDTVVVTNKYVWISWIGGSGNRVYMAVRDVITGERFAECKDVPGSGNDYSEIITQTYAEDGTAYPNRTLNIRNKPCKVSGTILDQYFNGESVKYNQVVKTNKYVWISWVGTSGNRVYMAVRDLETGERFAQCV